jgi:hypothetical protein
MDKLMQSNSIGVSRAAWRNRREYLSLPYHLEDGVRPIRMLRRVEMARTHNWTLCAYMKDSLEIAKYRIFLRAAYVGRLLGVSSASRFGRGAGMN